MISNLELCKAPLYIKDKIAKKLEEKEDWKKLMMIIPKDINSGNTKFKYTTEDQENIQKHSRASNKWSANILFEEWGTSGKQRPTLQTLKDLLKRAELIDAYHLLVEILNAANGNNNANTHEVSRTADQLTGTGSGLNLAAVKNAYHSKMTAESNIEPKPNVGVSSDILRNCSLIQFPYEDLKRIANDFKTTIGRGGFGDVFRGDHPTLGPLAIKKSNDRHLQTRDQIFGNFNTEVQFLSVLHHKNVVPILGISVDTPEPCIVCKYIDGESLYKNLCKKEKTLDVNQRMNIIIGVAEGLKYIHQTEKPISKKDDSDNSNKAYFVHGDVSSKNILLTADCTPMLCDFGLARQLNITTDYTKRPKGTPGYTPPERSRGTITQKGDVYSYGIVLLELLTGLKPVVQRTATESETLQDFVQYKCCDGSIAPIIDSKVKPWPSAQKIYELAQKCFNERYRDRPSMKTICQELYGINECTQAV